MPTPTTVTSVEIALGDRSYAISIGTGLIDQAATFAALPSASQALIVSNTAVAPLYAQRVCAAVGAHYPQVHVLVLPDGEAFKTWETLQLIFDALLAHGCDRKTVLFALGGGVVGDMTGFAAASFMRGVPFVQIPTTLLAQVDSSVGGKTAINSEHGKNLIGAFHQPSLVLADTSVLATLDPREFRAGYAEVAKYGLIDDAPFFTWLEQNWEEIFARGPALTQAIATSCRSKAAVVARDETEQGDRALLNLGHTFGHALESLTHFNTARLNHGEGVAIGLGCAFRFSVRLGHCAPQDAERVERHLRAVGLPAGITDIAGWNAGPQPILDAMFQDKKVERGALTFILARGIGQTFIAKGVPAEAVSDFLRDELGN
jgi:3-dehydroquinate synthase